MERHDAIRATIGRAALFAGDAKQALRIFPPSAIRQALMDVADYTVRRGR